MGAQELEKDLQDEENRLADIRDSAQEKGQMGFLRMAAQVDNYRKKSGKGTGEYEADAKAAVLRAVLPAFAPFEEAEEVNFYVFFLLRGGASFVHRSCTEKKKGSENKKINPLCFHTRPLFCLPAIPFEYVGFFPKHTYQPQHVVIVWCFLLLLGAT